MKFLGRIYISIYISISSKSTCSSFASASFKEAMRVGLVESNEPNSPSETTARSLGILRAVTCQALLIIPIVKPTALGTIAKHRR